MQISLEKFVLLKKSLKPKTKIKILSGSMEPFIYTGETILCSPISYKEVKVGDPIVFWQDEKLICHFLVAKKKIEGKEILETKGLSRIFKDPIVPESHLLGKVVEPKISPFKRFIFTLLSRFSNKS